MEGAILRAFLREPMCQESLDDVTTADFSAYRDRRLEKISSTITRPATFAARQVCVRGGAPRVAASGFKPAEIADTERFDATSGIRLGLGSKRPRNCLPALVVAGTS